jgi:hypothetical protein
MRIVIKSDTGPDVEVHVHSNGTGTVRVDDSHAGSCKWHKDGNRLLLILSDNQIGRREGLTFEFDDK